MTKVNAALRERIKNEYQVDYGRMLWEGEPVGVCAELDRTLMMKFLRSGMKNSSKHPQESDGMQLTKGREKADLLESASGRPPVGAVAFVGSSTFTYWRRLREDFAHFAVYNAAFGGSRSSHQLDEELFERLVVQHRPSCIVYFCGTNDIAIGQSADVVRDNFATFCRRVRQRLGDPVHILYVAITKTPFYRDWGEILQSIDAANAFVAAFCKGLGDANVSFVDPNGEDWVAESTNYVGDNHHLNDKGHSHLADVVRPLLRLASSGTTAQPSRL